MRILLLAPHPFYKERGTPIACKLLCEALIEQGHTVEMLTYPTGDSIELKGLSIQRVGNFRFPFSFINPLLSDIPIGLSIKKLLCDAFMAIDLIKLWAVKRDHYDVIHAGEESVFLALFLGFLHASPQPVVYDMDSSLADQVVEKFPQLKPLAWFLEQMERIALRNVQWVLPVCEALAAKVRTASPTQSYEILEDVYFEPPADLQPHHMPGWEPLKKGDRKPESSSAARTSGTTHFHQPLLMLYVGNLEAYQGIDLLLDSLLVLQNDLELRAGKSGHDPAQWVVKLIGGIPADVERYRAKILQLGLQDRVFLLGPRPLQQLPFLLQEADILLSPRTKGGNTPMKLYSYLASGVPIVATRINSHTQAVDEKTATLVDANPLAMANGMRQLLMDADLRFRIGKAGRTLALSRFSIQTYRQKLHRSYSKIAKISRKQHEPMV